MTMLIVHMKHPYMNFHHQKRVLRLPECMDSDIVVLSQQSMCNPNSDYRSDSKGLTPLHHNRIVAQIDNNHIGGMPYAKVLCEALGTVQGNV